MRDVLTHTSISTARMLRSVALAILLLVGASFSRPSISPAAAATETVVVAAGDIACPPTSHNYNNGAGVATACQQRATSDVAVAAAPGAVMVLGDNQYENGELSYFNQVYGPTWGRLKPITLPTRGNHEYQSGSAAGYFSYFGAAAGDPGQGWYVTQLGSWRVYSLNSNCDSVGGCAAGSQQELWLRADLAAHPTDCILAVWHHPRFSSGANYSRVSAFWTDLYAARADVVLNGHVHEYERFAPQTPSAVASSSGIREFVVGTGGRSFESLSSNPKNSEVRNNTSFGVLKLTLSTGSYAWQFLPAAGATFTDSGSGTCSKSGSVTPPGLATYAAEADAYVDEGTPATNFGSSSRLYADLSPHQQAYVRFTVPADAPAITRATLRLYAGDGTTLGPTVSLAANDWSESTVNWTTQPAITGPPLADGDSIASSSWYTVDVSSAVTGPGTYTFALVPRSTNGLSLYSRQSSSTTLRPQLAISGG
jgi:hypothetical protein